MDQSPSIGALAGALAKAQGVLPNVRKGKTAKILMKSGSSYSYKYADLADVWDAIRTPLANNGLSVVQSPEMFEGGLGIVTTIAHESGEWITGIIIMPVADHTPQALGSAITYLRRYGLCAMLGIVSDEDDDAQERQDDRSTQRRGPEQRAEELARRPTVGTVGSLQGEDRAAQEAEARGKAARAAEKVAAAPKPQKRPRTREEYIDRVKVLWRREVELGGATPGSETATNFNTATLEDITALGKAADTRVKALEAQEQPA